MSSRARGLSTAWERGRLRLTLFAFLVAFAAVYGLGLLSEPASGDSGHHAAVAAAALVVATGAAWITSTPLRRRRRLLTLPFPSDWELILRRYVAFYGALEPADQERFRRELLVFVSEKRVTGIGTDVDDTVRVLVGASAIIPIFGFPYWEWNQISEVLIYPERFSIDFHTEGIRPGNVLGCVGTGFLEGTMILSKPDLIAGFKNPDDGRNVGIHEFAHLVDKTDGDVDGLPDVGLTRDTARPWLDLVRREMLDIQARDSRLRAYGGTSEVEFFAVATEYFFERPAVLRRDHPELYDLLARVFQQPLADRAKALARAAFATRKKIGRNSPCPCGSGKKFKRCCRRLA